jgi:hypothetical protein
MLIHLTPKIFAPHQTVTLVDFTIDVFDMHLRGGIDVVARSPYPNKGFQVCCRNVGRKAMDGILLQTEGHVSEFEAITRWMINEEQVVTHHVTYQILDNEFDAATASMLFFYEHPPSLGGWQSRWPEWANGIAPAYAEPTMVTEVFLPKSEQRRAAAKAKRCIDTLNKAGNIIERWEVFAMPSIERERLFDERCQFHKGRMPPLSAAFHACGENAPRQPAYEDGANILPAANHTKILKNRLSYDEIREPHPELEPDLIFAFRQSEHVFSLDLETMLQCLKAAERQGCLPKLSKKWWLGVAGRYGSGAME